MQMENINAAINAILPCFEGMQEYTFYRFKHTALREYMHANFPSGNALNWPCIEDVYSPDVDTITLTISKELPSGEVGLEDCTVHYHANAQHIVFDVVELAKVIAEEKLHFMIQDNQNWAPNSVIRRFLPVQIPKFNG